MLDVEVDLVGDFGTLGSLDGAEEGTKGDKDNRETEPTKHVFCEYERGREASQTWRR